MQDVMEFKDAVFYIYGGALWLLISDAFMCKRHGFEVYVIWYIFSLFFLIFWGLEIIAIRIGVDIPSLCVTSAGTCALVYDSLTDAKGELTLLGAGLALVLGPQLMTYIQAAAGGSSTQTSSVLEPRYPQQRLYSRQIVIGGSVEIKITQRDVVPHHGGLEWPQTRLLVHGAGELVFVELLATRNDVKFFVREQAEVTSDVCIHVHLLFAK